MSRNKRDAQIVSAKTKRRARAARRSPNPPSFAVASLTRLAYFFASAFAAAGCAFASGLAAAGAGGGEAIVGPDLT